MLERVKTAQVPGVAAIAGSSCLFAVMAVLVRAMAGSVSAAQLVVVRYVVGLGVLAVLFGLQRRRPVVPRPIQLAMRGLFGGLAVYLYFFAIERLEVGPATVLNFSGPCYAAIFAVIFLKERLNVHLVGGLVLATGGALLVAWSTGSGGKPLAAAGVAAGLLSAVFSGAASTTIRSLRRDTDAATVLLSFCVVGLLVAGFPAAASWKPVTPRLLGMGLAIGLVSTAAQLLYTHAFGFVSVAVGSATTQLTPAIAWVLGVLFLGESVSMFSVLGSALCVSGVLWSVGLGGRARRPPRAPH